MICCRSSNTRHNLVAEFTWGWSWHAHTGSRQMPAWAPCRILWRVLWSNGGCKLHSRLSDTDKTTKKEKSTVRDGSTYVVKILEMLENIFLNQYPYYLQFYLLKLLLYTVTIFHLLRKTPGLWIGCNTLSWHLESSLPGDQKAWGGEKGRSWVNIPAAKIGTSKFISSSSLFVYNAFHAWRFISSLGEVSEALRKC